MNSNYRRCRPKNSNWERAGYLNFNLYWLPLQGLAMNWDSGLPEYSVNNHFEKKKKKMNEQIDGSFVRFQKRKVAAGGG